jgi:hypothetical protein
MNKLPYTPCLSSLLLAILILFSTTNCFASSNVAEQVMKARFSKLSKNYAMAKKTLPSKNQKAAEDILSLAAQLASQKKFKDADFLLDELSKMLKTKAFKVAPPEAKVQPKIPTSVSQSVSSEDLTGVTFTLNDAFQSKMKENQERVERKAQEEPNEDLRKEPKVRPFSVDNLNKQDKERFAIFSDMLPDVENTFKVHPNPETADAMKMVRRYYYYLKKKGMGFPDDPAVETEIESFLKEKVELVAE